MPETSKSIAVLPFVNMSSDSDNEYFSDGITEEIINALTEVEGLKVIARTSVFAFKGKNIDVREIGSQLGVSTILEGSVRKYGTKIRITAQLINALKGTHIWSKNFDRDLEDIFKVQDEISLLIADSIRENYGHLEIQDHLVKSPTDSVTAYEYFLKGRFQQLKWDRKSIRDAIGFYDLAIEIDPNYARAYYANLQCYGLLAAWGYMDPEEGFQKAILNFQKAKEIDTQLPEYYLSFIGKYFWGEWKFKVTYDQIKQSLELHPNYSDALEAMTELYIANGFFNEAEEFIKKALDTDPLSANHHYTLANINYMQKKYSDAIPLLEKAIHINPDLLLAVKLKAMCLIMLKKKDELISYIQNMINSDLILMLYEYFSNEKNEIDRKLLSAWENAVEARDQLVPYELFIMANSDHKKEALELLKKYVELKRGQIINYRFEPFLEPLHEFDEFHSLHISDLKHQDIKLSNKPKKEAKFDSREIVDEFSKVLEHIRNEKMFLNPNLSLNSLAESVNLHPNKLSFIINDQTGKNFNEFINNFRLQYFKTIAKSEEFGKMTILGLAYESGFNSKTVFNSYFKKTIGKTPKAWLDSIKEK